MSYNPNEGTVTLVKVLVALLIKPREPYSSIRDQDGARLNFEDLNFAIENSTESHVIIYRNTQPPDSK